MGLYHAQFLKIKMCVDKIYNNLWCQSLELFQAGKYKLDPMIESIDDKRRGITLLARFTDSISNNIQQFLNEVKLLEPGQYYYPNCDFHLTILSIITCIQGFVLTDVQPGDYLEKLTMITREYQPFKIRFQGVTASPACIMVQGFPCDNQLNRIREDLRASFKNSNLKHSIDSRYPIKTAHSTVIRFQRPVRNASRFIKLLKKYRDWDFGVLEVNELELVFNDWYQKQANTEVLNQFRLGAEPGK